MADIKTVAEIVVATGKALAGDENVVSFVCGKYADGSPRNVQDAINGEYLSPKQKKKATDKKKKKKKAKFKL